MADIERFRPDDRRQIEGLYRRVFGGDMADANRLRWDWQYRRNPNVPPAGPLIWIARDTDYGLHATVFTRDIDRAIHMARRLPCGTVSVNGFSEGDIKTPFGGYKRSGSLARDNGTEAMDQYVQTKTIWISTTLPAGAR